MIRVSIVTSEWYPISTNPNYGIFMISWPSSDVVLGAGFGVDGMTGAVLRSVDYGLTWSYITTTTDLQPIGPLFCITSNTVNNLNISIAGDYLGSVVLSTDLGLTWSTSISLFEGISGCSLGFNGNLVLSGVSNNIYLLASPYTNSTQISSSNANDVFNDISSYDGTNLIVVGYSGVIYYSSDSGSNLNTPTNGAPSNAIDLFSVAHGSNLTAIIAGTNSFVSRTTDGGASWTQLSVYASSSVISQYHAISFQSSSTVYIVGQNGEIYKSSDTGSTWHLIETKSILTGPVSSPSNLISIGVYDNLKGVIGTNGNGLYTLITGKKFPFL